MDFYVEQAVLDAGVKILFAAVYGIDNHGESPEWAVYREKRLAELYTAYEALEVHDDPILEGFNILHDRTGVKRRKNIPASENLIKLLKKNRGMFYINQAVDIYNLISLESKLALGAHNIDRVEGNVTLRFTDGSERFVPIGQASRSLWRRMSTATATMPTKCFAGWRSARWKRPRWTGKHKTSFISCRAMMPRQMNCCGKRRSGP